MSTVKISELPVITQINANTANTIFVGLDIPTNITGKMTLTTLARGLYSNNNLIVGNTEVLLPNAVAQYTGTSDLYVQTSLQNLSANGSGDLVVTADNGTDTTYFIDMGMAGSDYVFAGDSLNKPNDGYLLVVGDGTTDPGGNLAIGTLTEGKDINIFQGGLSEANVAMKFSYTNGVKLMQKPLTFADGTTQNTAVLYSTINSYVSSNVATLNGSISANANSANSVINSRITANIATANLFTQSAFDKANNALANTTGILGGSLTITQNLTTNGIVKISNSSFSATEAALTISASNTGYTQPPGGDGYVLHMTGKHNTPTRVIADSYGANGQQVFPIFGGRAARGNVTNPTAVQTNDILTRIGASGYGTTGWQSGGSARIDFVATENYTDSARGSKIVFYNMMDGTNTVSQIATFNANNATFVGSIVPTKGVVYTPRLPDGAQTAITVDFSNDSIIKAQFSAPVTVSFSNYTAGKIVEVWLINTAGNGQTITHGCLANNSTKGVTSFSVAAGQSAFLKYFSIDGDQANTFVAITYN